MKITRRSFLQAIASIPLLHLPSIPTYALQEQVDGTFPFEFPASFPLQVDSQTYSYRTYIPFYASVGNPQESKDISLIPRRFK